jgi:CopG family transcriptional regulator/antitoxin EndoAI
MLSNMPRRLNISLPEETVRLLDSVAPKGERSYVIAEAVTKYVAEIGKARLRKRMKERALKRADLDLKIAEDWFPIDEEAWAGKAK